MSVAFHPDPASVIARQARLGIPRSRPIVFRPAPAIPPAPGAAETRRPVARRDRTPWNLDQDIVEAILARIRSKGAPQ